ncbi:MAG: hypothetical protein Unbinned1643contig1000_3 [Prokaryotic dsDNA virus sp.]|nr:MAG: hypothetical protein Unbinned1643contig1000_3 [Prokaryotic dsDNA virus sp.]
MRHILFILLFMIQTGLIQAQDITILQVNAKWNQHNDLNIRAIRGAKIQYAVLGEQSANFQKSIKSVPALLIYKDQTLVWKQEAGLTLKLTISREEIQKIVDKYKNE